MNHPTSRRKFLSLIGAAMLAPAAPVAFAKTAAAKLDPQDPVAKALGYVVNVSALKPGQEPAFKAGANCGNCTLYAAAQESAGHAPCSAVGGKLVARAGWCRVHVR